MTAWCLTYDGFDPDEEGLRETLCTLGNGYLATRGAAPESRADGVHYPGSYLAGCYNRLIDRVAGHTVENESIVNLPNWLSLTLRVEDGPWLDLARVEILEHRQVLDIERGLLSRRLRFRDAHGRITRMTQRRFVHMALPHLAGLEIVIIPENYSGVITVRSGIDGDVTNAGIARYRGLASQHLTGHATDCPSPDIVRLWVRSNQSHIDIATAARTRLWHNAEPVGRWSPAVDDSTAGTTVAQDITVPVTANDHLLVEKVTAVFTSRDRAISEPRLAAGEAVRHADRFTHLLEQHVLAWRLLWDRFRFDFDGNEDMLRITRLHLFHLLQTLSPHVAELDVGIPARGLHGEAYRGHILWDELFAFPILTMRLPLLTRSLLLYRYRRLAPARWAARQAGYAGAMYPWQSGSDGREESQRLHLNPLSGRWHPDVTYLQRHAGIAVAYTVWQYYQVSGDRDFLTYYGAEMIVDIARFFASIAIHDEGSGRHVIRGVIGPDEFHTGYPDAQESGVDNNAYTNVMAAWLFTRAVECLDVIPKQRRRELTEQLRIQPEEPCRWGELSRTMLVPFHDGIISQFQGYERLAEFDWTGYRSRYGNLQRLDRILEAEGDSTNRYQVSKQADVLMLFYLLSAEELGEVFDRLGYQLTPDTIPKSIGYYLARTTHGSTLSAVVHAWVLARANRDRAMEFLRQALDSDITDIQGGTTPEGIHLAAMAGSVDLVQRCFTGIEARRNTLWLNPCWPAELGTLEFPIIYRNRPLTLRVTSSTVTVRTGAGTTTIRIGCRGNTVTLGPDDTAEFTLT